MAERAIVCTADEVRRLLAGKAVEVRLVVAASNVLVDGHIYRKLTWIFADLNMSKAWVDAGPSPAGNQGPYLKAPRTGHGTTHRVYSRLWIGDRLWAREEWAPIEMPDTLVDWIRYRSDEMFIPIKNTRAAAARWVEAADNDHSGRWRTAAEMPRWASRLAVIIDAVRCERGAAGVWEWVLMAKRAEVPRCSA